jgi:hypothetical protein
MDRFSCLGLFSAEKKSSLKRYERSSFLGEKTTKRRNGAVWDKNIIYIFLISIQQRLSVASWMLFDQEARIR